MKEGIERIIELESSERDLGTKLDAVREIFNRYARIDAEANPGWVGNFVSELRNVLDTVPARTDARQVDVAGMDLAQLVELRRRIAVRIGVLRREDVRK